MPDVIKRKGTRRHTVEWIVEGGKRSVYLTRWHAKCVRCGHGGRGREPWVGLVDEAERTRVVNSTLPECVSVVQMRRNVIK